MTNISDIERYLAARAEAEARRASDSRRPSVLPFITISRQAGAGGRSLGRALLSAMADEPDRALFQDWHVLDREQFESLLNNEGLQNSLRSLLDEQYHSKIDEFVLGLFGRQTPQDTAIVRQSRAVRSLAANGKVIIVGRAASQATKDLDLGIRIRLVAPGPLRVSRMAELLGRNEEATRQAIDEWDHDRARLLSEHYQVDIDDPLLYDAMWNTGTTPIAAVAAATVAVLKKRVALPRTHSRSG